MNNDVLLLLAANGDERARTERFVREVMCVDGLTWPEASRRVHDMAEDVSKDHYTQAVSAAMGVAALVLGAGSVPMVFHRDTALWFGTQHVTADVPEPKDLETWLEVGMWTWGWMEPPIGTVSFVFICIQFARGRGIKNPLEHYFRVRKERQLTERYSQYSPLILLQWAESLTPGQDYTDTAGPTFPARTSSWFAP